MGTLSQTEDYRIQDIGDLRNEVKLICEITRRGQELANAELNILEIQNFYITNF